MVLPCYIRTILEHRDEPAGDGTAPPADATNTLADRFEHDTIAILKRLSRRPLEPAPSDELMADLGFDSLQILELVGELEDHFDVAVPLNALTHIKTVGEIVAEVRALAATRGASS